MNKILPVDISINQLESIVKNPNFHVNEYIEKKRVYGIWKEPVIDAVNNIIPKINDNNLTVDFILNDYKTSFLQNLRVITKVKFNVPQDEEENLKFRYGMGIFMYDKIQLIQKDNIILEISDFDLFQSLYLFSERVYYKYERTKYGLVDDNDRNIKNNDEKTFILEFSDFWSMFGDSKNPFPLHLINENAPLKFRLI